MDEKRGSNRREFCSFLTYRLFCLFQPKLPKSREETHEAVQEYELKSSNNEDMIYKNDIDTKIIMFTTESNLSQDEPLFADGIFQYCPKYFYQLYTIHAFKNGQYVPCVFSSLRGFMLQIINTTYVTMSLDCLTWNTGINITCIFLI